MLYLLACGQAQLREFGENFSRTPAGLPLWKESDFSCMMEASPPTFSSNSHQWACCGLIICWTKQCDLSSGYLSHIILHFYANIFYFISPARILFTKFINWNLEPEYLGLPKESIGMRFPFSLKTWSQVKTLVKSLIDIKPPLWLNNSCSSYDET